MDSLKQLNCVHKLLVVGFLIVHALNFEHQIIAYIDTSKEFSCGGFTATSGVECWFSVKNHVYSLDLLIHVSELIVISLFVESLLPRSPDLCNISLMI